MMRIFIWSSSDIFIRSHDLFWLFLEISIFLALSNAVVPKLVRAVTPTKVAIMSYYPAY